jgi:hypothetical protein
MIGRTAFLSFLLELCIIVRAEPQVSAFQFDSLRVPVGRLSVGRLYEYLKSNRDGTHPGIISLYVAASDRLESLKWSRGDSTATLVVAVMDWPRFSVRSFHNFEVRRGAGDRLRGSAVADSGGAGLTLSFEGEKFVRVKRWPWHSYDFDFASLGLTLPHLKNPEGTFTIERVDVTYRGDDFGLEDLGPVEVQFQGMERRGAGLTRRYRIGGPGLQHAEGRLWVDAGKRHIVEFELPVPDEPGYPTGVCAC